MTGRILDRSGTVCSMQKDQQGTSPAAGVTAVCAEVAEAVRRLQMTSDGGGSGQIVEGLAGRTRSSVSN